MAVYFIQHGEGGEIKIGTTSGNPYGRMATLQTGAPSELKLLVSVPGGAAEEKALHERFAWLRTRGEWFRPEPALLSFIEGLCWQFKDDQPKPEPPDGPTLYGLTREQVQAIAGALWMYDRWDRAWTLVSRARGIREAAGVCVGCAGPREDVGGKLCDFTGLPKDPAPWCEACDRKPHRWVGLGGGLPAQNPVAVAEEAAYALETLSDHLCSLTEPTMASPSLDGAAFARTREQVVEVCQALAAAFPTERPSWAPTPLWAAP